MNCPGSFPRRKCKNRAPTSYRPGPILSPATISFELHVKVAEEIDLEMCSYGQLSKVQMLCDLDLDLGWGQRHVNIHSTYKTISLQNHVTVVSRSSEIWPFEVGQISTIGQSLNSCDSFPRRKFNQKVPQGGCGHRRQHARLR